MQQLTLLNESCRWDRANNHRVVRRFVESIDNNFRPWCSNNFDKGIKCRGKWDAFDHRSIQVNPPWRLGWFLIDVDRPLDLSDACNWDVRPSITMLNPDNGHYHLAVEAKIPVFTGENAGEHQKKWAKRIQNRLCTAFGGDHAYNRLTVKNPLHADWQVAVFRRGSTSYTLQQLENRLKGYELHVKPKVDRFNITEGRHDAHFDDLRFWGYPRVHNFKDYSEWFELVLEYSGALNTFEVPLQYSDIKSTAKSVAQFCWENAGHLGKHYKNRGVMGFGESRHGFNFSAPYKTEAEIKANRQAAAERTAQIKRTETEKRIIDAIGQLTAQNKRVTKAAIARLTGLHRKTLQQYYSHIFTS